MKKLLGTWILKTSSEKEQHLRGIYLLWDRELLRQRINLRAKLMLDDGVIEEVQQLNNASETCKKAIGVSIIQSYLANEITHGQCEERIAAATRQYAKRQRTWFSKEKWLTPFEINDNHPETISDILSQWSQH